MQKAKYIKDFLKAEVSFLRKGNHRTIGKYFSLSHFVLKNARVFTLGGILGEEDMGRMGECFKNAFNLVQSQPYSLIYCEGYALPGNSPLPTLHAWCVSHTGVVYDPTWKDGVAYLGVPMNHEYVIKAVLGRGRYGVLDNWENRWPALREDGWKYERYPKKQTI